jgi:molecular chaperone DnaK (HSP70)
MTYAVGIDLGTTNSAVSVFRRGVVETLPVEGRSVMPSVISFRDDGSVLVGQPAKSRLLLDPENTIASAKRFMGDRSQVYAVAGGRSLTPVDVGSLVLKQLINNARKALGEDVWDAVITVPAYFTEAQREDTKRAGEEAGLNVLRLIPEPTAAAVAYGLDKGRDQTLMVYDLGGGTFDVSILEVKGNSFNVKAVGGNSRLGGDDFDQAIMVWAAEQFQAQTGVDLLHDPSKAGIVARQRLKEAAEAAKIELSQSSHAVLAIPDCLGHPLEQELSLTQYNKLIEPFLCQTVDCMKAVLADAKLTAEDIDRVILVGGSTKNLAVQKVVAAAIKEPYTSDRVDEVVSHGAAILAAGLSTPDLVDVQVSDVTAHSLGVDMLVQVTNTITFIPIILRQTTYPCRQGVLGFTLRPMQKEVVMRVYRGESASPEENDYRGELSLPVSPPQREIVPVAAIFALDSDGIIDFTAVQLPTDARSTPIQDYAAEHDGSLDLPAIDALVKSNQAKTKSIKVASGEASQQT